MIAKKAKMETLEYQLEEVRQDEEEKQNFMTKLYENDVFRQEKIQQEKQIIDAAQAQVGNKNFLSEMDTFLQDLQQWKDKRNEKAGSDLSDNDVKKLDEEKKVYESVDAEYMR